MERTPATNVPGVQLVAIPMQKVDSFRIADAGGIHKSRLLHEGLDWLLNWISGLEDALQGLDIVVLDSLDHESLDLLHAFSAGRLLSCGHSFLKLNLD